MAAPTVTGRTAYADLAQNHSIALPDTTGKAGQLLVVLVGVAQFPVLAATTPYDDGWTCLRFDQRSNEHGAYVWAKVSDGTETTFDLDIQTDTRDVVAYAWIIDGWAGYLPNALRLTTSSGTSNPSANTQWIDGEPAETSDVLVINTGVTSVASPAIGTFSTDVPDSNDQTTSNNLLAFRAEATATASTGFTIGAHTWTAAGTPRIYTLTFRPPVTPPTITPELVGKHVVTSTNGEALGTVTLDPRTELTLEPGKSNPGAGTYALLAYGLRTNTFTPPTVTGWTLVDNASSTGGTGNSMALYIRDLDGTADDIWSAPSVDFLSQAWVLAVWDNSDGWLVSTAADSVEMRATSTPTPDITSFSRSDATDPVLEIGLISTTYASTIRYIGAGTAGRRAIVDTDPGEGQIVLIHEFVIEAGCETTTTFTRRALTWSRASNAVSGTIALLNSTASSVAIALATGTEADTASPLALAPSAAAPLALATAIETVGGSTLALSPTAAELNLITGVETVTVSPLAISPASAAALALITGAETFTGSPVALAPATAAGLALASALDAVTGSPLSISPGSPAPLALVTGLETETGSVLTFGAGNAALALATAIETVTGSPLTLAAVTATLNLIGAAQTVTGSPLDLAVGVEGALNLVTALEAVTGLPVTLNPTGPAALELAAALEAVTASPLDLSPGAARLVLAPGVEAVAGSAMTLTGGPAGLTLVTASETVTGSVLALLIPTLAGPIGFLIPGAGLSRIVLESPTGITIDTGS